MKLNNYWDLHVHTIYYANTILILNRGENYNIIASMGN